MEETKHISGKFPKQINEIMAQKGVDLGSARLTVKADMDGDGVFCDVFAALCGEKIAVLTGVFSLSDRRSITGKVKVDAKFEIISYDEYDLGKLDAFAAEELISTGRCTARRDGEFILLFGFTGTYKPDVQDFADFLNQIKEKGTYEVKEEREETRCPKCGNRYPDKKRQICPHCMERGKLFARLGIFAKKHKKYIAVMIVALTLTSGIAILTGYVSGIGLYDRVLDPSGDFYGRVGMLVLIVAGMEVFSILVHMVHGVASAVIAARVVYDLRLTIFEAFQRLSMTFFSGRQTGGLMTQLNSDSQNIYWFLCDGVPFFMLNFVQILVVTTLMFVINPFLTLMVYIAVPVFLFGFNRLLAFLQKLYARHYSREKSMNSLLADVLSGVRVVKAFSKEKEETARFDARNKNLTAITKQVISSENTLFPSVFFLLRTGRYIVWVIGGMLVLRSGSFTFGMLMSFVFFLDYIYNPLGWFVGITRWFAHVTNSIHRLFEIYDANPDIVESENPVNIESPQGAIEFKDVEFSYIKSRKIIDNISLSLEPGEVLGIVGKTGAGKSTLANLLTRLYDVNGGSITVDGVDIRELSFACLHGMVSIVSQETYLFVGTIADNIRYAAPNATDAQVIAAAKLAAAHDFIMKQPEGYQTKIGYGFKDLSGGERQRISIARAVLKDPRILIMDEATAAMDTETERQIQRALAVLTKGRTTIMIAHRLSTLRDADRLAVINDGKLAEVGTHVELLSKKGLYFDLYKKQAQALSSIGIEA